MNIQSLEAAMALALAAGLSIPLGALVSSNHRLRDLCNRHELDSFMSYLGGGALMAAITLVLVPRGLQGSSLLGTTVAFLFGGLVFWRFSRWSMTTGNPASQFAGMALDFFPEALLLGISAASGGTIALLLAALIAVQNMPEGFASYHEMLEAKVSARKLWVIFTMAPLMGPLAAWLGFQFLADYEMLTGSILLFCSGGVLFLIFQDIAPRAHHEKTATPALGAILGFLFGMIGTHLVH